MTAASCTCTILPKTGVSNQNVVFLIKRFLTLPFATLRWPWVEQRLWERGNLRLGPDSRKFKLVTADLFNLFNLIVCQKAEPIIWKHDDRHL